MAYGGLVFRALRRDTGFQPVIAETARAGSPYHITRDLNTPFRNGSELGFDVNSVTSDPRFEDPGNPAGPDGVSFTGDDGLGVSACSPLAGGGRWGGRIGAMRASEQRARPAPLSNFE